jgi:hypothetical protein
MKVVNYKAELENAISKVDDGFHIAGVIMDKVFKDYHDSIVEKLVPLGFQPIKSLADVPVGKTVWLYNIDTNYLALGALVYIHGWVYVISNGIIYAKGGIISSECELDDEYEFTHFALLPELPKKEEK